MSSLQRVKQAISIIDNICVISATPYAASDQKSGRLWIDQSTTTRGLPQFVQHFSATDEIAQVQQPPYSPDLAPCNFLIFRNETGYDREIDDVGSIK
jgi:hypothetical protein